ncbi:hypothetical protein QZM97_29315 [Burkholderia orbicola]|uniref:hypothetical protein n=1 Tax=Burkholderia orbicola TaxID=2978683 RepID=UPI002652B9E1|nr:hypothetical protein [Burkholderia orbicola]MDN7994187.1 hypothetical protein [Burkholderia orbicola]
MKCGFGDFFRVETMRELSNGEVRRISGAGVAVGGSIVGFNGGNAMSGISIGNGAHVVVNGKPITVTSALVDGVNIDVSIAAVHPVAGRRSVSFADFFPSLSCRDLGWRNFLR